MAYDKSSLDDYVDVATRLAEFRGQYPQGRLAPLDPARPWEQATVTGYDKDGKEVTQTFVVVVAAAYREPGDTEPGVGMAWEVFPGRTPYTRGSELMNAETSAWGRAMLAALAADSRKGIASQQEVRNRRAEQEDGPPRNRDGTLSVSRMTEEERSAAGVMTKAQTREHTELRPDREPGRIERDDTADPGEWEVAPEDRPGSVTPQQRSAVMAECSKLGIKARDERLEVVGVLAGREVASVNDLSYTEAGRVLEGLHARAGGKGK